MAKIESFYTTSLRFERKLNVDLDAILGTYSYLNPRLHFMTSSIAPMINDLDIKKVRIGTKYSKILVDGFVRYYYPFHTQTHYVEPLQFELSLYVDVMLLIYKSYSDRYKEFEKKWWDINILYDILEMCAINLCHVQSIVVEI